jgi:hypothetical protein
LRGAQHDNDIGSIVRQVAEHVVERVGDLVELIDLPACVTEISENGSATASLKSSGIRPDALANSRAILPITRSIPSLFGSFAAAATTVAVAEIAAPIALYSSNAIVRPRVGDGSASVLVSIGVSVGVSPRKSASTSASTSAHVPSLSILSIGFASRVCFVCVKNDRAASRVVDAARSSPGLDRASLGFAL